MAYCGKIWIYILKNCMCRLSLACDISFFLKDALMRRISTAFNIAMRRIIRVSMFCLSSSLISSDVNNDPGTSFTPDLAIIFLSSTEEHALHTFEFHYLVDIFFNTTMSKNVKAFRNRNSYPIVIQFYF